MIEALIVVMIVGLLAVMIFFTAKFQLAKGRDARRKSDLAKIQRALEDYMNDRNCYPNPEEIATDYKICRGGFSPYLSQLPCDPINNSNFNYFYSCSSNETCKSWYKIYIKLENAEDPAITKAGCTSGCGPGGNYNYWGASPNMNRVEQIRGEEDWWPSFPLQGGCIEGRYYGCFNGECIYLGTSPSCWPNFCSDNCDNSCKDKNTGEFINNCVNE